MDARLSGVLKSRDARPYLVAVPILLAVLAIDHGQGRVLTLSSAFSVLQQFATIGPTALALGLTMIAREFDLSVAGMTNFAGCVAVLCGVQDPLLGILAAGCMGLVVGAAQGFLTIALRLSSVAATLGGLLTLAGAGYVITGNATVGYPRMDVALMVNSPVLAIFSLRSIFALTTFVAAALILAYTRIGRDLIATGSDPQAARVAGVRAGLMVVGVFAVSGFLAATGGALVSYSIAAASPAALTNTLIPAVAAAIIGGVSLSGGRGTPLGIAGGVLLLSMLRTGMSAVGIPPFAQDLGTGIVLFAVALADAEHLRMRFYELQRIGRKRPA
ncbi:ABC transporter permease [Bradyrhizobium archetypum]|uniref:ABC transporter permease n=1 Tax=Bradyrhizobium archetypum TaxID=2721160 RepID=A0A7Y4H1S9_9BRAD|nr:ABC transporter permease [Bradyrhizobium archetypum]NOJ45971.1 ABC transporter permease [Bradyrhizobium archetypum]